MYPNLGHAPIMKSGPCCLHLEFLQLWRNNAFCLQHIFFLFVLVAFLLLLLFLPSPFATLMFVQFSLHKYYSTNLAQIIMPWCVKVMCNYNLTGEHRRSRQITTVHRKVNMYHYCTETACYVLSIFWRFTGLGVSSIVAFSSSESSS